MMNSLRVDSDVRFDEQNAPWMPERVSFDHHRPNLRDLERRASDMIPIYPAHAIADITTLSPTHSLTHSLTRNTREHTHQCARAHTHSKTRTQTHTHERPRAHVRTHTPAHAHAHVCAQQAMRVDIVSESTERTPACSRFGEDYRKRVA